MPVEPPPWGRLRVLRWPRRRNRQTIAPRIQTPLNPKTLREDVSASSSYYSPKKDIWADFFTYGTCP
jgi:hypothetical protein